MSKEEEKTGNYFAIIDRCAKNSENFPIPNSNTEHAAYVMKTLFHHANSEVCIFTGGLFEGVYGDNDVLTEAINFLKKDGVTLTIAYQEGIKNDNSFRKSIMSNSDIKDVAKKVKIYDASKTINSVKNHFCVADRKAFRYELVHDKHEAIANFGDKENAQILCDVFGKIIIESSLDVSPQ